MRVNRIVATVLVAVALLFAARRVAFAHASLVRSEPIANGRLAAPPARVLLVFSEPLEISLARLSLEYPDGHSVPLASAGDPHDVNAVIAPLTSLGALPAGAYRVKWRVVSADGHPVQGVLRFAVTGGATAATATPGAAAPADSALRADSLAKAKDTLASPSRASADSSSDAAAGNLGPSFLGAPLAAAMLRALALGALLPLAGLLLFAATSNEGATPRSARLMTWLAVLAPLFAAAHLAIWLANAAPGHALTRDTLTALAQTRVGRVELIRTGLTLLVPWALLLARRSTLALLLAGAAVAVGGASGHSAALHASLAIPSKAVHLLAAAVWSGGLLWLLSLANGASRRFAREAKRVSSVALAAVILVALSGLAQAFLFVDHPLAAIRSAYGVLVIAKVAGLALLVVFGAHHKLKAVPALSRDPRAEQRMTGTLRGEVLVMALVIALGALLAYVPPPTAMAAPGSTPTARAQ